jgi:hypothetical protein
MKKTFLLSLILLFMLACVITPPEGLFSSTPTICVECVQATICAENASGDSCPLTASLTLENTRPPLASKTIEPTPTEPSTSTPTVTVETLLFIPTYTPNTEEVSAKQTPELSQTPTVQKTEGFQATSTGKPSITSTLDMTGWIYKIQSGSPKYTTNFSHPELACKWSGVAGQVFGPGGVPQENVVVVVTGEANGENYDLLGFTTSAVKYGASAYEVEFPFGPVKTTGSLQIQLFDLEGKQLTGAIPFDTFADCNKNLIVFNFTLVK